jgi:hypothetical protein
VHGPLPSDRLRVGMKSQVLVNTPSLRRPWKLGQSGFTIPGEIDGPITFFSTIKNAEQQRHRGGHAKNQGRNTQWRQRSLIEVCFERPYEDRTGAASWHRLKSAAQIGQQRAVYPSDVDHHAHPCENVLRHREIQRRLPTPLESSKWLRMNYPDDAGAATFLVDDRGSNRVSPK